MTTPIRRRALVWRTSRFLGLLFAAAACGLTQPDVAPPADGSNGPDDPGGTDRSGFVVLLVGDPGSLNASEDALRDRLGRLDLEVRVRDDDGFATAHADGCDLVVMSKTVDSETVGTTLKPVSCPVVFWEDNQQKLDMLATIDNDGSGGTAWHSTGDDLFIRSDAPASLRAGLEGELDFYTRRDEITFSPRGELVADAIVVAEFDERGGNPAVYVLEGGARLADGSRAAGRRVYFGLYDDTFRLLTSEGLALFDAALGWALR
ncbi:MAG: hypothetical protein KY397_00535 [Gemmatimonadetes bacterium]|nr:hypothetical protein [Gemmatimonadota bacterium]